MKGFMTRGFALSLVLLMAIGAGVYLLGRLLASGLEEGPAGPPAAAIGRVRIEGGIFNARDTVERIERLGRNPRVKGLLLRIDTPGGGVGATQEIYEAVRRFRKTGRKVVASLGAVAASGGYYIAVAADRIYANPGTITGSIGVVMVLPDAVRVLDKVGLRFNVVKSAPHKDLASPLRAMTDAERGILQRLVDDTYGQFIRAVAGGRNLPEEKVRRLADGSVFSGERARKLGLVDELGTERDAMQEAARLAGIRGEPEIIEHPPGKGLWRLLTRSSFPGVGWWDGRGSAIWGGSPAVLQYLWR